MSPENTQKFESRIPLMLELGLREAAISELAGYIEFLWASNEELNLISRRMTFDELIDNHVIDCLLPLKLFPKELQFAADFGSGGGLPGVLYAIQFPKTSFHLFEKSPKKQEFLNRCKSFAPNLTIHGEIPKDLNQQVGPIEIITARAFKPVDVILDMSRTYLAESGKYFLLKGRREKIDGELTGIRKKFKDLKAIEVSALTSPILDVERHLVLINFPQTS